MWTSRQRADAIEHWRSSQEPFAPGWTFVAEFEARFDPYSLKFSNGTASIAASRGVPLTLRVRIMTSSHAGQIYNALGFLGVSSDILGTLTFFRQNAFTLDGVIAYDPMAGFLRLLGARLLELQLRRRRHRNVPNNHGDQIPRQHRASASVLSLKSAATV